MADKVPSPARAGGLPQATWFTQVPLVIVAHLWFHKLQPAFSSHMLWTVPVTQV